MRAERYAAAFLILVALAYTIVAFFFIPAPVVKQQMGPSAFPRAIGVVMLILTVSYGVRQFLAWRAQEDETRAAIIGAEEKLGSYVDWRTVAIFIVLMLAYAFSFERLGYPIATFAMFVIGVMVLDRRHLVRDIIIAFIASFVVYYVFSILLRVQLPAGPLAPLFDLLR